MVEIKPEMLWGATPIGISTERPILAGRSEPLERLLAALKREDRLFEYNVPAGIRVKYDDTQLLAFLKDAYDAPVFAVEEPDEIRVHARLGDHAVKRGSAGDIIIPTGTEGTLEAYDKERGIVTLKCKKIGKREMPANDIQLLEAKVTMFSSQYDEDPYAFDVRNAPVQLQDEDSWSHGIDRVMRRVMKGHNNLKVIARYAGPGIQNPEGIYIPDGTEGTITRIEHVIPHAYKIAWTAGNGVRQQVYKSPEGDLALDNPPISAEEFILVVRNQIDLESLCVQSAVRDDL